jgi:hypothetical protein
VRDEFWTLQEERRERKRGGRRKGKEQRVTKDKIIKRRGREGERIKNKKED